jgi:hypothetical protein
MFLKQRKKCFYFFSQLLNVKNILCTRLGLGERRELEKSISTPLQLEYAITTS